MSLLVSDEIARGLAEGAAIVALESTLICHGFPRPGNAALALEVEAAVRAAGALPATIAVLDGRLRVGLARDELVALAAREEVAKCSARDLALTVARGGTGATTVAATVQVAAHADIKVMATGGIGGVHRGGETSLDVSADLDQLARSPVAVVCSGAKVILDLGRTLERLETLGVPVVGYRCAELPGFYTPNTGLAVPRVDDLATLARLIEAQGELGATGVVVAQPPPAESALPAGHVDRLVDDARRAAAAAGGRGPAETPFLLRHMAGASDGATVRVNRDLVLANARLAGELARLLAGRRAGRRKDA